MRENALKAAGCCLPVERGVPLQRVDRVDHVPGNAGQAVRVFPIASGPHGGGMNLVTNCGIGIRF
jgi:hypothetical protein